MSTSQSERKSASMRALQKELRGAGFKRLCVDGGVQTYERTNGRIRFWAQLWPDGRHSMRRWHKDGPGRWSERQSGHQFSNSEELAVILKRISERSPVGGIRA